MLSKLKVELRKYNASSAVKISAILVKPSGIKGKVVIVLKKNNIRIGLMTSALINVLNVQCRSRKMMVAVI
jgi:hypothetical protein